MRKVKKTQKRVRRIAARTTFFLPTAVVDHCGRPVSVYPMVLAGRPPLALCDLMLLLVVEMDTSLQTMAVPETFTMGVMKGRVQRVW